MPAKGNDYIVEVKPSHIRWGEYRNPTNRKIIKDESYVKIPSKYAKRYDIKRGDIFTAHFTNGCPDMVIKASGNGPRKNGVQYAKQFEGVGKGACKAFTPWYRTSGINVGDDIRVKFLSERDIVFEKI